METSTFLNFIRLVVAGDTDGASRCLSAAPALARTASPVGATRQKATEFFFTAISHYLYAGDTALHMAAAAFSRPMAELLMTQGADCRARNRRGAEPLHYAADGGRREPRAQAGVIEYLISMGAEPNAVDKTGVAPLHRAVRTRSLAAVRALLDGGADARKRNKSGSTPLHLAVQPKGRAGAARTRHAANKRRLSASCWNAVPVRPIGMRGASRSIRRPPVNGFEHC